VRPFPRRGGLPVFRGRPVFVNGAPFPRLIVIEAQACRLGTLRATVGFLRLQAGGPELQLLHPWLDTWSGLA